MTKALISIDYTYDFVADDGKLTAGKPAQSIASAIADVTEKAYRSGDYIFLRLIIMILEMFFIQRPIFFLSIILKGLLVETYMVLWELYMKLLRKIVVFFG